MPSRYQPRGRVRHDLKGRPGDTSARLGGVHGPELVARGRAARSAAGRLTELAIRAQLETSIADGRTDMALFHARTLELINAGYAGGDAPGLALATTAWRRPAR